MRGRGAEAERGQNLLRKKWVQRTPNHRCPQEMADPPASAPGMCEHTRGSGAGMSKSTRLRSTTAPRMCERSFTLVNRILHGPGKTEALMHMLTSKHFPYSWWCHQVETFSALLAVCAGNSPVTGEFPAQRPVTRSFDVFFDLQLNKQLSRKSWGWWF